MYKSPKYYQECVCESCGNRFFKNLFPYMKRIGEGKFCSRACINIGRKQSQEVIENRASKIRGKKMPPVSREVRRLRSIACKGKKYALTHGFMSSSVLREDRIFYRRWYKIRARCNDKNQQNYYLYGGRGIKCLWESFEDYRDDMFSSYKEHVAKFGIENTQIDRINNNGNYCKDNCRWATKLEQANNKRNNVFLNVSGVKMSISQFSVFLGKAGLRHRIGERIKKYGKEKTVNHYLKSQ